MEEVSCPDMVDVIVSEPMGYMLLSDKLMGSFLHARKWLKPDGRSRSVRDAEVDTDADPMFYAEIMTNLSNFN